MNAKQLAALADALNLAAAALEVLGVVNETVARLRSAATVEVTDADLAAFKAQRMAALDRLKSAVG